MGKTILQNLSSFALKKQNFWLASDCLIKTGNLKYINVNKHKPPKLHPTQTVEFCQWVTLSSLEAIKIYIDSLASLQ